MQVPRDGPSRWAHNPVAHAELGSTPRPATTLHRGYMAGLMNLLILFGIILATFIVCATVEYFIDKFKK